MNVLVPVDFTAVTEKVMKTLAAMPGMTPEDGTRVYVAHVAEAEPDFVGYDAGPDVVRDQVAQEFRREHRQVGELAERLKAEGIDATPLLIRGPIVETLLVQVQKLAIDLLVVGSHGHGAAYDLVVGSISAGLIRKARVPVLVVGAR